ncbi:restriction endonuclease subunit S [Burkholderia contaminans]|uniref:restriction endonuclease subunit S n=1 Tax=Burkholderia contaminans TaxID=488447 RepID=UPI001C89471B|nr:restriction endonuclease subunit S [Burkholderia contaminans]
MILIAPDHIECGSGRLIQERTASAQAAISGKYLFDSGDIVYSKIRPYLRKATIARFQGLCSADMYPLKTRKGVESGFILPVILGHRFSIFAEGVSARTGIPKINREDLSAFSIALPPQNEQRAIAAALSDVDALLSSLDALIAKKRDIKQAAMQQLLTGKTRLPGFGGEWEVKRLGDCLLSNPDYGINAPAAAYSDNLPVYIRITDIDDDGRFNPSPRVSVDSPYSGNYILQDGDVVFARTGASVGKSYLYRVQDGPLVFAGFLIRVRPNPKLLMPDFLAGSVTTKGYWNWVRLMSMRSGQPGINGNEYATLPLLLPPIEEQAAIAEVLSDMDAELAALKGRRDKTRLLKQGMMQELLTGKTRLV